MTQEKIKEGNILIAEFMGYRLITPEMRKTPRELESQLLGKSFFKGQ